MKVGCYYDEDLALKEGLKSSHSSWAHAAVLNKIPTQDLAVHMIFHNHSRKDELSIMKQLKTQILTGSILDLETCKAIVSAFIKTCSIS